MKCWYNIFAVFLLITYPTNLVARPNNEISIIKTTSANDDTTLDETTNKISSSSSMVTLPTPTTINANNTTLTQSKSMVHNVTDVTKNQRISTSQQPKVGSEISQEIGITIQSNNNPFKLSTKRIQHHEQAKAHQGIAVPMTLDELEEEMAASELKQKDSSTSKDGISTWILLGGINSTPLPETSQKREDLKMGNQKIDKIAKVRDSPPKPQRVSATATVTKVDLLKNKNKSSTTTTTTETTIPTVTTTSDLPHIKSSISKINQMKNKLPQRQQPLKQNQQKHKTSSTTDQSVISISSNEDEEDKNDTKEFDAMVTTTELASIISKPITKEIPTPFLILEPKDADFDLPQDRSPGKPTTKITKRPNNKNKKKDTINKVNNQKQGNVTENKNGTKIANKIKDKPMSTKIYNYLSREVMPTVGVGLLGLVVTAGLAGYFFGPLGALRRSYDVADRKDDLYYYNNEEYAGPGADGQSEEEIFGKVIAGMPVNSNYRNNMHYPNQQQQQQRVNQYQGPIQKFGSPNYQHNRNNAPHQRLSPHNLAYNSHPHQYLQRNHLINSALPNPNIISQKSINSSPVFALPQAQQPSTIIVTSKPITTPDELITTTTTEGTSSTSMIDAESFQTEQSNEISSLDESSTSSIIKLNTEDDLVTNINSNVLKHRKSPFVVGSVLPADAIDSINRFDEDATVILPEHGPRRRRRRSTEATVIDSEFKQVERLHDSLKKRFDNSEKNDKITKEIKLVDYELIRLRRIVAEIEDIQQFQTELHILVENSELPDTLTIAISQITSNIKFINELLDSPKEINEKIKNRKHMTRKIINSVKQNQQKLTNQVIQKKSDESDVINIIQSSANELPVKASTTETSIISTTIDYEYPPVQPTGLLGLLKFIELKAAFGVNVLRSIRPAFDRAFEDVFRVKKNQTEI